MRPFLKSLSLKKGDIAECIRLRRSLQKLAGTIQSSTSTELQLIYIGISSLMRSPMKPAHFSCKGCSQSTQIVQRKKVRNSATISKTRAKIHYRTWSPKGATDLDIKCPRKGKTLQQVSTVGQESLRRRAYGETTTDSTGHPKDFAISPRRL